MGRPEFITLASIAGLWGFKKRGSNAATNLAFAALRVAALAVVLGFTAAQAGGLAFDPAGNLFVADGHSIFKYTPDGTKTTFAAGLRYPLGLCFDDQGNLFVGDGAATGPQNQSAILKFSPNGTKSAFATVISSFSLICDRSGNLLVKQGRSILKFTPAGAKSTFVFGLGNPIDMALDGAGNLFVVDLGISDAGAGYYIYKIGPDGTKSRFSTGLVDPSALAADAVGQVYAGAGTAPGNSSHTIFRFSPDGARSTLSSALGPDRVWGLAIDRSGNVFARNGHAVLKVDAGGNLSTFTSDWVSPDKQWEYSLADNSFPEIVKISTTQVALDLGNELSVPSTSRSEIIWAPDSKRFGFNYSPPHASHTTYQTVAFFRLRDDKWMALPSPVDEMSERSQLAQLANKLPPDGVKPRDCSPIFDVLKLRNWIAADTAILYAPCEARGSGNVTAGALLTLKFDDAGTWKIVNARWMSKNELDNEQ